MLVEVDIEGRTPLIFAAMRHQGAMCKLLLERGASLEPLKAFASSMDILERSKLLDPLIAVYVAIDDGSTRAETALGLLVQMALRTNHGGNIRLKTRAHD